MTRKTRRGGHRIILISKFLSCIYVSATPLVGALQFCLLVEVSSCQYTNTHTHTHSLSLPFPLYM